MAKVKLTDRFIRSREAAPAGQRIDYLDALVPGLALRVTDRSHLSFVLIARYPLKPQHPTRRALGGYGELTLEQARDKARAWLAQIARGVDPRIEAERQRAAARRAQAATFEVIAEAFLVRKASGFAKSKEAGSIMRGEFIPRWRNRPAGEIEPSEAAAAIRAIVDRGAPYQAHNALGLLKLLYSWAIGTGEFGLENSPAERLRPKELIGKRALRTHVINDRDLECVWGAMSNQPYPYGPLFRLLLVTGQRVNEVAQMSWGEIDLDKRLWTIPAERMKGDTTHEVPLSRTALEILGDIPQRTGFVFSTTQGATPVNGFSKAKSRLDRLVASWREGEGFQNKAGEGAMPKWVLHDLRRTVRTHLSALPVQDIVRELVIAHAQPGLRKVYDQYAYRDEKRQALELWAARLDSIVYPKKGNVSDLAKARKDRTK